MPHNLSTKKRLRQSVKLLVANRSKKQEIKTRSKSFEKAVKDGDLEQAQKLLDNVVSRIDKASKDNIIHPNKAARMKSRLADALNSARSAAGSSQGSE